MGTRPTVFKWKTIRDPRESPDGLKAVHAARTDATLHTHPHTTRCTYKQIRETTTGEDK